MYLSQNFHFVLLSKYSNFKLTTKLSTGGIDLSACGIDLKKKDGTPKLDLFIVDGRDVFLLILLKLSLGKLT